VAGVGAAAVAAAVYVLTQHVLAGLLLLACVSVVVPTLLFSGIGGLVMALRFLRLSSDWRHHERLEHQWLLGRCTP